MIFRHRTIPMEVPSQLYIGDYFADTLHFAANEHSAFGALLLHLWLAGAECDAVKIALRAHDGKRLPPAEWHIVRAIVLVRDNQTCAYCSSEGACHVDHIIAVSRGGSNTFENLTTSCDPRPRSHDIHDRAGRLMAPAFSRGVLT